MQEMLDAGNPKMWDFSEDGNTVMGYAVRLEHGRTEYGPCRILILDVRGEERSVWLLHTALISKLERLQPMAGDFVGIRQLGERKPQSGGREYMDYEVKVLGQKGVGFEWGNAAPALIQGEVVDEAPDAPMSDPSPVDNGGW